MVSQSFMEFLAEQIVESKGREEASNSSDKAGRHFRKLNTPENLTKLYQEWTNLPDLKPGDLVTYKPSLNICNYPSDVPLVVLRIKKGTKVLLGHVQKDPIRDSLTLITDWNELSRLQPYVPERQGEAEAASEKDADAEATF